VDAYSSGAPGTAHKWGEHHGIDLPDFEAHRKRGYKAFCFVRNPWDLLVSWWQLWKQECEFPIFIKDLDNVVFYTLPDVMPNRLCVLAVYADTICRFEGGLDNEFSRVWGEQVKLGNFHRSQRSAYETYYTPYLRDIVAERCSDDIEDFGYVYNR
jgi:hypothetical protein